MFLNHCMISGKIIRGPFLKRFEHKHPTAQQDRVLCKFRMLHNPTYRTTFRHLKVWVKIFGKPAEMVDRYIKYKDWVMVTGSLYLRRLKVWKKRDSYGNLKPYEEIEIWGHTVDLMQRPWDDQTHGRFFVNPDTEYIRVPISEYQRLKAFDDERSRWDIPRHKATDVLDQSEIDEELGREENPYDIEDEDNVTDDDKEPS